MAVQVYVFGHSFVKRLTLLNDHEIYPDNLGLNREHFNVQLDEIGGLKLSQRSRLHSRDGNLAGKDLVLVDIGSNDICQANLSPEQFALNVVSYASYLIESLEVKKVVLLQLLKRDKVPFLTYNSKVVDVNTAMQALRMASSAKKRRAEKEDSIVQKTVSAVLEALKEQGVLPSASTENNSSTSGEERVDLNPPDHQHDNVEALLLGATNESVTDQSQDLGTQSELPSSMLGTLISINLKKRIWNNDFIELADLLTGTQSNDMVFHINKEGQLAMAAKSPNKSLNMDQWISAFTIFIDIYVQKFPKEVSGLLSYLTLVRDLERTYGIAVASYYDRNFRDLKSSTPLKWGQLHHELWIKATTLVAKTDQINVVKKGQNKVCFKYNKASGCVDEKCITCMFAKIVRKTTLNLNVLENLKDPAQQEVVLPPLCPLRTAVRPLMQKVQEIFVPSPIKSRILDMYLSGYDTKERSFLVTGFSEGFRIPYQPECLPLSRSCRNHPSALKCKIITENKIFKEIESKRIIGPLDEKPNNLVCSPLALIPKSEPGAYRLIHDLSYPHGRSVNDSIARNFTEVRYDSIDTVVEKVKICGRNSLMAKTDIENAFRLIPIHSDDRFLLGFNWDFGEGNKYFVDCCLAMGLNMSCQLFTRFSDSLQWIMESKFNALIIS